MAVLERLFRKKIKSEAYKKWESGLEHELSFWDDWVENQKEDLNWRLLPQKELQGMIKEYLNSGEREKGINILDVGAGPITFLGNMWGNDSVNITAIDALADKYTEILRKKNLVPPIKTIQLCAEDLQSKYSKNTFHLAYSFNALDHAHDPIKALKSVVEVIKPGSYFLLRSFVNEAENADYTGLHQWNFFARNEKFYISSDKGEYDVEKEMESIAKIVNVTVKNELFGEIQQPVLWVDIRKNGGEDS